MRETESATTESPRVIRGAGGVAIVAGSMLGIGIFLSPPIVAGHTSSSAWFLAIWALGGLTALAGAVACAELGTLMPRAGGDYVFQYEAYGPSVAFASGWVLFAGIFSGSIATLTVGLCTYQLPVLLGTDLTATAFTLPWGSPVSWARTAALAIVPALTALNARGTLPSTRVQTALTVLPIALLAAMAIYVIATGSGAGPDSGIAAPPIPLTLDGAVLAYMAVYFAYSGWINIIYVAGEVETPQRNIPLSLVGGTLLVTALYLLLCVGFVRGLGMDGLREAGEAGTAIAGMIAGPTGRILITVLIASALLASINATVLGGARVAYAMAQGGAAWSALGRAGRRTGVPQRALWLQAALACALILSGSFEALYQMVSLSMVLTGMLTVGAVFVLRRSQAAVPRPYHATGYPWLPGFYVLSSLLVLGVMSARVLSGEPGAAYPLLGLGVLVAAFAAHRLLSSREG